MCREGRPALSATAPPLRPVPAAPAPWSSTVHRSPVGPTVSSQAAAPPPTTLGPRPSRCTGLTPTRRPPTVREGRSRREEERSKPTAEDRPASAGAAGLRVRSRGSDPTPAATGPLSRRGTEPELRGGGEEGQKSEFSNRRREAKVVTRKSREEHATTAGAGRGRLGQ